ncbi:hypothetical protein, partial [Klebsiella pneumoniae]
YLCRAIYKYYGLLINIKSLVLYSHISLKITNLSDSLRRILMCLPPETTTTKPILSCPACVPLARPAHTCFTPQRAVLSPPRLPASWVGFNATATGNRIRASSGGDRQIMREILHAE